MDIYKNICSLRKKLNSHNINYYVHDNPKISACALKLGAEVIHRPRKLSDNHAALEPVIFHVLD